MSWPVALLDPARTPQGVITPDGAPATRRFDVYRNNVLSSLVGALRDGFPAIHSLVGEAFFAALAAEFVRAHPPTSPILNRYGTDFPTFLEGFPPAATLPYLADVARLELLLRAAYHAEDTTPVDPTSLDTERLDRARITLAPSCAVLTSAYPVYDIWRASLDPMAEKPTAGAQCVLVTRPDWDPVAEPISSAEAQFFTHLSSKALAEAVSEELDLAQALTRLIGRKAILSVEYDA